MISFTIAINKYSHGFIEIHKNSELIKANDFELPFDIAENIAYTLSYIGDVELINEFGVGTFIKNGKVNAFHFLENNNL